MTSFFFNIDHRRTVGRSWCISTAPAQRFSIEDRSVLCTPPSIHVLCVTILMARQGEGLVADAEHFDVVATIFDSTLLLHSIGI